MIIRLGDYPLDKESEYGESSDKDKWLFESSARDWLATLVCGYPHPTRARRRFLMLTAYLDDSGSDGKGPVFVMGGCIASAETWAKFSDEWCQMLASDPKIDYFKMAEANGLRGQFGGWSIEAKDKKVSEALSLIRHHSKLAVMGIIYWDELRKASQENSKLFPLGYQILFLKIIWNAVHELWEHGERESIEFIFDDQGSVGNECAAVFHVIKEAFKETVPPGNFLEIISLIGDRPVLRDEKKVKPLQAADIVAWHARRFFDDGEKLGFARLGAFPVELGGIPGIFFSIKEDEIRRAGNAILNAMPALMPEGELPQSTWRLSPRQTSGGAGESGGGA